MPGSPEYVDTGGRLLMEDYVTALAEDKNRRLYVGHRQKGLGVYSQGLSKGITPADSFQGFVDAVLVTGAGDVLLGSYGKGLVQTYLAAPETRIAAGQTSPPFPLPALPPTPAQLSLMLQRVQTVKGTLPVGVAVFLGEDWQTEGDWVGRYGRQYTRLSAMSITDHLVTWNPGYHVAPEMGPQHHTGDSVRYWIQWLETDDPRCLYSPIVGHRRESEWDDHGEAYASSFSGPDIWIKVTLPQGDLHRISLYFVNPNGHGGNERYRDYEVEIRPYRNSIAEAEAEPVLAHARVHRFWGGVYEQFLVRGPGRYYVKIAKNGSYNTLCSGVFIDRLTGPAYFMDSRPMAYMGTLHYDPPTLGTVNNSAPLRPALTVAEALWTALDDGSDNAAPDESYRLLCYRAARAAGGSETLLANWRWRMRLWTPEDRAQFAGKMAKAWASYQSQLVPVKAARVP